MAAVFCFVLLSSLAYPNISRRSFVQVDYVFASRIIFLQSKSFRRLSADARNFVAVAQKSAFASRGVRAKKKTNVNDGLLFSARMRMIKKYSLVLWSLIFCPNKRSILIKNLSSNLAIFKKLKNLFLQRKICCASDRNRVAHVLKQRRGRPKTTKTLPSCACRKVERSQTVEKNGDDQKARKFCAER